jgi:hypothetical protein
MMMSPWWWLHAGVSRGGDEEKGVSGFALEPAREVLKLPGAYTAMLHLVFGGRGVFEEGFFERGVLKVVWAVPPPQLQVHTG